MRVLPGSVFPHPGERTAFGYLRFVARRQWITLVLGASFDTVWLTGLAVTPWAVGRAIDQGIIGDDRAALVRWIGFLVVVALVRAWAEAMRDRTGISNWNQAAFGSVQMVGHRLTRTGGAIGRTHSLGEVLAVQNDAFTLSRVYFLVGGLISSLLSYTVVAVVVLRTSVPLGIFILVGVPAFAGMMALVARPLHRRQQVQRDESGEMTGIAADAVNGLRVLCGVGGEGQFLERYRQRSARTRRAGIALANPIAALEGLQVLLGGLLVVVLTWVGGILVVRGELRPGELVTFYGYAGFLVIPVTVVAENLSAVVPALVGSRKVLRTMNVRPAVAEHPRCAPGPPAGARLSDRTTGVEIAPGSLVALTSPDITTARRLLERLARVDDSAYAEHDVRWGGADLARVRLDELRARIRYVGVHPHLYHGTLREALDPYGEHDDAAVQHALDLVGALDILESAAEGLDSEVVAEGRNFSGGQRQRLGLARALLARPEILLLDDPTSSVDVHTQHRIVAGLVATLTPTTSIVVATNSPLVLGRAGTVHRLDVTGAAG